MHFIPEYEIDARAERAVQGGEQNAYTRACIALYDYKNLVNSSSDGWAYWTAGVKAADRLITLVERGPSLHSGFIPTGSRVTDDELKKALSPIRSFCTRKGLKAPF